MRTTGTVGLFGLGLLAGASSAADTPLRRKRQVLSIEDFVDLFAGDKPEEASKLPKPTAAPVSTTPVPIVVTDPPVDGCSTFPRKEAMEEQLEVITDVSLLTDPATPQGRAFVWLVDQDPAQVDPCSYPTLAQRYALATLYFATGGDSWTSSVFWLNSAAECLWSGISCRTSVTSISLCRCKMNIRWHQLEYQRPISYCSFLCFS